MDLKLIARFSYSSFLTITMYCDNRAAMHIVENPIFHKRTKHLWIDSHYTRDKVSDGFLLTSYVPSKEQLADLMTKPLRNYSIIFLA